MADRFPKFENDEPILNPIKVNDNAEGYDAFARSLGAMAKTASETEVKLEKDKSQTMYINSVADAQEVKASAQQQLLEYPDQADSIAKNTNQTLESIKTNAFVNDQDRKLLDYYLRSTSNEVSLKATQTEIKQKGIATLQSHYASWPKQLNIYREQLIKGQEKEAVTTENAMQASLDGLFRTGMISPHQYLNSLNDMQQMAKIAEEHHYVYGKPDLSSKDYHTLNGHPLNNDKNNTEAPVNESMMQIQGHHNSDKSTQTMLADVSQGKLPDAEAFDNASESDRKHVIQAINGVREANGILNSGTSIPVIRQELENLKTEGIKLSYKDQAKRDFLQQYIKRLDNGELLSLMAETPNGNAVFGSYTDRINAVQLAALTPEQKADRMIFEKNRMLDQVDSWRIAHHIPDSLAYIAPKSDVSAIEENFNSGGDPKAILQVASTYNKRHYGALAKSIKNPVQGIALEGVLYSSNIIPIQSKLDFLAAQQSGLKYPAKEVDKASTDQYLRTQIYSYLQKPLQLIWQNNDPSTAKVKQDAMVQSVLNYTHFLANKDINPGVKGHGGFIFSDIDAKGYVAKASNIMLDAYQMRSGNNWIVSNNQLPANLSDAELDSLAAYVVNQGEESLKQGRESYEYESAISRNPLKMIITPMGTVQAVDGNNQVYYSQPFTSTLIAKAQHVSKTILEEQRRRAINEANERMQKQLLHVRLPDDAN